MHKHLWLVGPCRDHCREVDIEVDCHRRLRGPYTGLGSLLRALVPKAYERSPELVQKHLIELLSVAPELEGSIDAAPETLTSLGIRSEQIRIYPLNRTRRLAHGAFEFLESYAELSGYHSLVLSFINVEEADYTDQEFLAIALRRAATGRIRIIVKTSHEEPPAELAPALYRYAHRITEFPAPAREERRAQAELLQDYINSDGTSDDPTELAAYQETDSSARAVQHDARATELEHRGEWSLRLGAIPYHHEHGGDRARTGGKVLLEAADYCFFKGFYHALLDYGKRGRAITDPDTQMEQYWNLSTKMGIALAILGRSGEAEPVYLELRGRYTDPVLHMNTGYALTMLYTRLHPSDRRDHHLAKTHINNSIAIASLLPQPDERIFNTVFFQGGLALVEMHMGNLPEALRLVQEGLDRLNRELPADKHRLYRSVLVHNRGKVYAALGRLDDALADFSRVIEMDPNYPDYYFDRADIRRKLGDPVGALADYNTAITLTPPFYELHYNRADLRAELGDFVGAITDLSYVVELEPDQLDARINLVDLLLDTNDMAGAQAQIEVGLRFHPGDPRLLHARGLLALENGATEQAQRDFNLALDADAHLMPALASRAALAYEAGNYDAAISDLTTALQVNADNPDLLYNRGYVYQMAGHWKAAVHDYTRAMELAGADRAELLHQRGLCHAKLGDTEAYYADLAAAMQLEEYLQLAGTP